MVFQNFRIWRLSRFGIKLFKYTLHCFQSKISLISTEVGKTQLEAQLPQPPQLRKLHCALIFYFEALRKLRCGIKPLKFVAL